MRDKLSSDGQTSIDAFPPFAFSLNLLYPPPREVVSAPEITFGIVCLFSDADRDGKFGRFMDPGFIPGYARIDSLTKAYEVARESLFANAETKPRKVTTERFYLDRSGLILREDGPLLDTMWTKSAFANSNGDINVESFAGYVRTIGLQNRWERFFAHRKKENEYYFKELPAMGYSKGYEVRYDRALYPKPGLEPGFRLWTKRAVTAWNVLVSESERVHANALLTGMLDYPFAGYGVPQQDWMAGRSILDLLLFIPGESSLDSLLDAYPGSSFRISHLERFRPGYNLVRCNDQYVCDVRAAGDSIQVYLGTSEAYFNTPGIPSKNPFATSSKTPPTAPVGVLDAFQGSYSLNGSDTLVLVRKDGELWCDALGLGLVRVLAVDSFGVYSPYADYQGLFTAGSGGRPDRMVQYRGKYRTVYQRVGASVSGSILSRIEAASGFKRADLADSVMTRFEGRFEYGADTLTTSWSGGDSLNAVIPGLGKLVFFAENDSMFRCPWGEWLLRYEGFGDHSFDRVVFKNGNTEKVVPATGRIPSKLVKSVPMEGLGIQWESSHSGSGHDAFIAAEGGAGYKCSEDGFFLRPGDGYLDSFSRTGPSDSISLRQGGDVASFRLTGMAGRIAFLELRHCAERVAQKGKRIRVSVWAGSDRDSLRLLYGDHQWMASDVSGATWSFDSLAIASDPYILVLKQEDTRDAPFRNAFDGYRLGIRP